MTTKPKRTIVDRLLTFGSALAVLVAAGYIAVSTQPVHAKPPLGKRWPTARRISMREVDHSPFNSLVNKYVDENGYVDYSAWQSSTADRDRLQDYLAGLSRADLSRPSGRDAQLAFWINAYNAVTIEGILQVYPTSSIRNHTSRFGGYNIWKNLPLLVSDRAYALEDIEHQILRKLGDPRIHFAIVCASVGCPRLRSEAYFPERVERQLADNAKDFFSRSQNLRVDTRTKTLHLSSILKWFGEDFGDSRAQQLAYIQPYLPRAAQRLAADPQTSVKYLDYDWSLNDQARLLRSAARR